VALASASNARTVDLQHYVHRCQPRQTQGREGRTAAQAQCMDRSHRHCHRHLAAVHGRLVVVKDYGDSDAEIGIGDIGFTQLIPQLSWHCCEYGCNTFCGIERFAQSPLSDKQQAYALWTRFPGTEDEKKSICQECLIEYTKRLLLCSQGTTEEGS